MKPQLACDVDLSKVEYPCIIMPKLDGVRGCHFTGKLTGRSLKQHANKYTSKFYGNSAFHGFDGELCAAHETDPDLCRVTTSALNTIVGEPFTLWWLFDYVTPETEMLGYEARLKRLADRFEELRTEASKLMDAANPVWHLRLVPWVKVNDETELLHAENLWLAAGYEGLIGRSCDGKHKNGRATANQGTYWRLKRFIEEDAVVISLTEGQQNNNEAQINELGQQFRSSHQEGMVPNGMIGSMECDVVKDVFDPQTKQLLLSKGQRITVSPGNMPHHLRKHYWCNQQLLVGATIKFKFFPKGQKDKPRFPTYISHRAPSDQV
ncbi:DNA ligase [Pseudomonas phage MiCath]|uniref:DNA ligase n=1 Tax=Pseudomonas phage MiCath TaxID=3003729 RepID=A0AAE9VDX4_9CAUD|nr:DNA ligase [Pseudomonas phage MiCath]WAX22400.1 DNA ligase [Pseudomonas phage MiCath]